MNDDRRPDMPDPPERAPRSPLATVLLAATVLAAASAVVTFLYGIYSFPDAPIRPSAGGYVGKTGKPHTADEFETFRLWERAMLVTFPATFLAGFAYELSIRAGRRKSARAERAS